MSDQWLFEAATKAAKVAAMGYEKDHQEAAFLRGFANRVLMNFAKTADEALKIDFTGRAITKGETTMQTNLFAYTEPTPTDGYPGFVSLNRQPDGAVTLTVRSPGDGGRQIGSLTLPADAIKGLAFALASRDIDGLTSRFLTWPVPADVHPDGTPGQPGRTGTNLLSAPQAKEMLQHVLGG